MANINETGGYIVNTGFCPFCGEYGSIEITDPEQVKGYLLYMALEIKFIQDALPTMSPGLREQIMTGAHESCFDSAFAEYDDE